MHSSLSISEPLLVAKVAIVNEIIRKTLAHEISWEAVMSKPVGDPKAKGLVDDLLNAMGDRVIRYKAVISGAKFEVSWRIISFNGGEFLGPQSLELGLTDCPGFLLWKAIKEAQEESKDKREGRNKEVLFLTEYLDLLKKGEPDKKSEMGPQVETSEPTKFFTVGKTKVDLETVGFVGDVIMSGGGDNSEYGFFICNVSGAIQTFLCTGTYYSEKKGLPHSILSERAKCIRNEFIACWNARKDYLNQKAEAETSAPTASRYITLEHQGEYQQIDLDDVESVGNVCSAEGKDYNVYFGFKVLFKTKEAKTFIPWVNIFSDDDSHMSQRDKAETARKELVLALEAWKKAKQ